MLKLTVGRIFHGYHGAYTKGTEESAQGGCARASPLHVLVAEIEPVRQMGVSFVGEP